MDEVLKIALEREIVALPLAATTPPVEMVRSDRAKNGFHIRPKGRSDRACLAVLAPSRFWGLMDARVCDQCSPAGSVSGGDPPGNRFSGKEQCRQVQFAELPDRARRAGVYQRHARAVRS